MFNILFLLSALLATKVTWAKDLCNLNLLFHSQHSGEHNIILHVEVTMLRVIIKDRHSLLLNLSRHTRSRYILPHNGNIPTIQMSNYLFESHQRFQQRNIQSKYKVISPSPKLLVGQCPNHKFNISRYGLWLFVTLLWEHNFRAIVHTRLDPDSEEVLLSFHLCTMTDMACACSDFALAPTDFARRLHALDKPHLVFYRFDLDPTAATALAGLDIAGIVGTDASAVMTENLAFLDHAEIGTVVEVFEGRFDVDGDVGELDALVLLLLLGVPASVEVEGAATPAELLEKHVEGIPTTPKRVLLATVLVTKLVVVATLFAIAQNFVRFKKK